MTWTGGIGATSSLGMENNESVVAAVDQFLAALSNDDMDGMVRLLACPNCESGYPTFHVPIGSIDTLCDYCGWSSEDEHT